MQITEQTTSQGVRVVSAQLADTEQYSFAGHEVTGVTVFAGSHPTGEPVRPVHFYLAGPETVQGPFDIDEVRATVPPSIRGGVQQLLDRAQTLTPAPASKSLGRRLGKGHWRR